MNNAIIRLHEADNTGVCIRSLAAGESIDINGVPVNLRVSLHIGHKLALQPILTGEPVIKYGVPIGTATVDITVGEHVHTHNIKSNYIPTYA